MCGTELSERVLIALYVVLNDRATNEPRAVNVVDYLTSVNPLKTSGNYMSWLSFLSVTL
jgi:hypothetical protein